MANATCHLPMIQVVKCGRIYFRFLLEEIPRPKEKYKELYLQIIPVYGEFLAVIGRLGGGDRLWVLNLSALQR